MYENPKEKSNGTDKSPKVPRNVIGRTGLSLSLIGVVGLLIVGPFTPVITMIGMCMTFLCLPGLITSIVGSFWMPRRSAVLGIALGVLGLLFIPTFYLSLFVFPGTHDLGSLPRNASYTSTRFEFRYGHALRVVDDPGNHMQWVYGGMPDSITVKNGQRLIVYKEPRAVIKSRQDSMDVQNETLKHKGYMGVWSKGTHFFVDDDGVIH
jgi:hypothetical protein